MSSPLPVTPPVGQAPEALARAPGWIRVRGARTHNLQNIDVDLPQHALVVITGLSGSGKSSLAFDTLYAEGQRRYVESLSAYARQFLQLMDKPDVDSIEGLSPAISIEQKATSHNPRSTVGTVTEIHDYLRLLYARAGTPFCPEHHRALQSQSVSQMVDACLEFPEGTRLLVMAPLARSRKGEFAQTLAELQAQGFVRFRIDGQIMEGADLPALRKGDKHDVDVVVDRLRTSGASRQRLAESLETALQLASGKAAVVQVDDHGQAVAEHPFSLAWGCPQCSYSLPELEPRLFSFNSPLGACPTCDGLGQVTALDAQRVVAFPSLSLAAGAIKGWDRRNTYTHQLLQCVAAHYGFDVDTPFEQLSPEVQAVVLHGSGTQDIAFVYQAEGASGRQRKVKRWHPFEGIVPSFERRLRETDSPAVREDIGRYLAVRPCGACEGTRMRREARHVFLQSARDSAQAQGRQAGQPLYALEHSTLSQCLAYFDTLELVGPKATIGHKIISEIRSRLRFLNDVGLTYLSLDRSADTLSGGEAQRIRLASQIGSGLTGVLYVLDEPSIGLHQRDNERLLKTLLRLRDLGNSVVVVEHDEDLIRAADHVVDMGPGAGVHGGRVLAQGTPHEVAANDQSVTGAYLRGQRRIEVPATRRLSAQALAPQQLYIRGARGHNLRQVDVAIPLGVFTCVTGVSGSGKSTLINDTLYAAAARRLHHSNAEVAACDSIDGLELLDKVINVDQSPIGRTPRSNPATYTGLFTPIRELFAEVPAARERGYGAGRFSFNVSAAAGGGRCEACQGDGVIKVEMHFLPDVYVPCETCAGLRFNRETLEVRYKGLNVAQVLALTVEDAHALFAAQPHIARRLKALLDVGLGYVRLGQSATTLSGGEAQRVKLALELGKRDTGRTLYILDEPTTGLHFHDIQLLLKVLHQLCDAGNTVVVIEHNLDVIKTADWVIDLGPEGGAGGGQVVAQGTPEQVAQCEARSYTAQYLREVLQRPPGRTTGH